MTIMARLTNSVRQIAIVSLVIVLGSSAGALTPSQKPIRQSSVFVEQNFVPETLEELWSRSTAVVSGHIGPGKTVEIGDPSRPPLTYTRFAIVVQEVFKNDTHVEEHGPTYVLRYGYERDAGDHIAVVEESDFPMFKPGETCVLFLIWNSSLNAHILASGPNGSYCAVGPNVKTFGTSKAAEAHEGRSLASLLSTLRTLAGR